MEGGEDENIRNGKGMEENDEVDVTEECEKGRWCQNLRALQIHLLLITIIIQTPVVNGCKILGVDIVMTPV